ncbi:hypothetical protein VPH35_063346 [Triticum aestivum]
MSSKTVPKQYYALVDDVKRISKINWNAFTLRVLLDCLRNVRKGKHLHQWPRGNLALLQYLYWEKVQPLEGECAFNPSLSMEPLMRNWTGAAASRRDKFDYDHGRGRGNIKKTPAKLNVDKTTKPTDECGATPENPWIVGNSPRAESSDIDISASSIDRMVGKSKGKKSAATAKEDDVISGKCRRTVPKKFESPFKLDKPGKRSARGTKPSGNTTATRALFSDNDMEGSVKDNLTPELIDAAVAFVEAAARSEKNMTKRVYYNERGTSVTVESIRPIIDAYQTHLALRVGHDRHLCPAWRSKYLVDRAKARDNPKPLKYNMDSALSRAGAVRRVLDEYTVRDKSFTPLNVGNTHWITVVMHNLQKEFRVFDSLYPIEFSLDTVKALGTINARRRRLVAELVLSPTNTLECVKNKIRDTAKKSKA